MLRSGGGEPRLTDVLSIMHDEVAKADSAAFRAPMQHLRKVDSDYSIVLTVRGENEVGLLGGSQDSSPAAEARFHTAVLVDLIKMIRIQGWQLPA